jgi:transcriptional regulator
MHASRTFRDPGSAAALETVRAQGFGLLISASDGGHVQVTPCPFHVAGERPIRLVTHLAAANPQARALSGGASAPVTAFFLGPHAYVSPTWHRSPGRIVPTWNHLSVEVRGHARRVDGTRRVEHALGELTARHEGSTGWRMSDLDPGQRARLAAAVTVLEIDVEAIEQVAKLSQNRSAADRARIRRQLQRSRAPGPARAVGDLMASRERACHVSGHVSGHVSEPPARWRAWLRTCWQRYRSRQRLAGLDARGRADLGIRWEDGLAEARKPFWRA